MYICYTISIEIIHLIQCYKKLKALLDKLCKRNILVSSHSHKAFLNKRFVAPAAVNTVWYEGLFFPHLPPSTSQPTRKMSKQIFNSKRPLKITPFQINRKLSLCVSQHSKPKINTFKKALPNSGWCHVMWL